MAIEVRIVSGARAGQTLAFDQPIVVVGRQANVDLRFDPKEDLDVSGRHAELRFWEGKYFVHDSHSTNGTFVNGDRVTTSRELNEGDSVQFGAKGPTVEIHIKGMTGKHPVINTPKSTKGQKSSTEVRIAAAVKEQTRGLKRLVIAAVLLLVAGAGGAFYISQRTTAKSAEELNRLLAVNDSMRVALQSSMGGSVDTALMNDVQTKVDALQKRLAAATTDDERARIRAEIEENQGKLRRFVAMDLGSIFKMSSPATAILISDIAGANSAGTGFGLTAAGLMLTNRHNVRNEKGELAKRIAVKFTETGAWLPAHIVKVAEGEEDLALIQLDREGPFPVVSGISSGSDVNVGISVATIGYPLGYDTPQEGEGNDFIAKPTLNPGTVSKKTSTVLQIDSYATHGSSGSPVFSARGLVVGVVYAGQPEANGRIVYAVPPEKVAAFIPDSLKALIKN